MQPNPLLRSFLQHPLLSKSVGGCFLVALLFFGHPFDFECKDNDNNHNLYRF